MENNHLRNILEAAYPFTKKGAANELLTPGVKEAAPVIAYCNLVGVGRTDAPKPTTEQLQTFYNLCVNLRDAVRKGQTFLSSDYVDDRESLEIAAAAVDKARGYCETLSARIARDSSFSELLSKGRPAAVIWSTMAASLFTLRGVFVIKGKTVQPTTNQDTPSEAKIPLKKGRKVNTLEDFSTPENIAKLRPFCKGKTGKALAYVFMAARCAGLIAPDTEVAAFCREFGLTDNQARTVTRYVEKPEAITGRLLKSLRDLYGKDFHF